MKILLHRSSTDLSKWYFTTHKSSDNITTSEIYDSKQKAFQGMFAEMDVMFTVAGYDTPKEAEIEFEYAASGRKSKRSRPAEKSRKK